MFIAALVKVARKWKEAKCLLAEEWIHKIWYIHTVEYCSAIKGIEYGYLLLHKCMIKNMLSERSWTKGPHSVVFHLFGMCSLDISLEIGVVVRGE